MGGPITSDGNTHGEAKFKKIPNNTHELWWCDPGLRMNMLHCIGLCGTLFFNGYDGSLFNGLQSIDAWQEYFDHPTSNTLGLMNCAGFLPGLIVCWLADWFGSYYGRRYTVWIGSLFAIFGALIISLAASRAMFIGGRVVLGIGVQGTLVIAPSLLQEIAHPRYRAKIGSLYMSIYYVAAIISACVCRGTITLHGDKAWRVPCFLQIVGPTFVLIATCTCPESPRWLVKKGHEDRARQILVKYHANGKDDDPLVEYEYHEILEALREEDVTNTARYSDFLKGSGNRLRLLIIMVVSLGTNWVGNGIIGYYLSPILTTLGITSRDQQLQINIGLQVWNFILSTAAALNVDKVGRRPLWIISTVGLLFSFSIVMGLSAGYDMNSGNKALGIAVIPFFFIFYGFYDIAWTPLSYSYSVEILVFSLRTKGQAIFVFMQTLGMSVNLWVNPVALEAIHWKYYGLYIAILFVLVFLIYFKFPETKNLTIEEIAVIFDGRRGIGNSALSQGEAGTPQRDIAKEDVNVSTEHVA